MRDELVLADSAGHTMIDIEAAHAADRAVRKEAGSEEEDTDAEE